MRLSLVGIIGLVGANRFEQCFIAPLEARRASDAQEAARLRSETDSARNEILRIQEREQSAKELGITLNSLHQGLPAGSPFLWLPSRLKATLAEFGFLENKVQGSESAVDPALPDFENTLWRISISPQPSVHSVTEVLLAFAYLERSGQFMAIRDVAIHTAADDPSRISGSLNIMTILPEAKSDH